MHIKILFKFFNKMHVYGTKVFFPPYLGKRVSALETYFPILVAPSQRAQSPLKAAFPTWYSIVHNKGIQPSLDKEQVLEAGERFTRTMRSYHSWVGKKWLEEEIAQSHFHCLPKGLQYNKCNQLISKKERKWWEFYWGRTLKTGWDLSVIEISLHLSI